MADTKTEAKKVEGKPGIPLCQKTRRHSKNNSDMLKCHRNTLERDSID